VNLLRSARAGQVASCCNLIFKLLLLLLLVRRRVAPGCSCSPCHALLPRHCLHYQPLCTRCSPAPPHPAHAPPNCPFPQPGRAPPLQQTVTVPGQAAITKDNVRIDIDAVLYLRIVDPEKASYGVSDSIYALTQLAQTTMRSELGKISLDKCFEERESLNLNIVNAINSAALAWGAEVLRYEIKDIVPPASVKAAMDMQAEAERRKRAEILESEGRRESAINNAEGMRKSAILAAQGEAEAIRARAQAQGAAIGLLASAIAGPGGREAVSLRVAEQYVDAFGRIAKAGTTMLLPADAANPASMIAQAMSVWSTVAKNAGSAGGGAGGAGGARPPPLASLAEAFAPRADFAAAGDAGGASSAGPAGGAEAPFVPADIAPAGSGGLPSAYRSEASRAAGAAETLAAEQQASGGSSAAAPRGAAGFTPQPY